MGDDGCLGRSCNIDDKTARNDIDAYMDSLNKGPHAGHKPREARKVGHEFTCVCMCKCERCICLPVLRERERTIERQRTRVRDREADLDGES